MIEGNESKRSKCAYPKCALYISIISLVSYLGIMPKCIYQEQKLPILEKTFGISAFRSFQDSRTGR